MRIIIVSYQGFEGAGVLHAHEFANCLVDFGHDVIFLLNGDLQTVELLAQKPRYELFETQFTNGILSRGLHTTAQRFQPDIIHLWTPRHLPARVGLEIWESTEARLIIHYEDDEQYILKHISSNQRFCADDLALYYTLSDNTCSPKDLDKYIDNIDVEFLQHTIMEPKSWRWSHPVITPVVEKLADGFTSISPAYQRVLRRRGFSPVHLLYPGVEFERFSPHQQPGDLVERYQLQDRVILLYSGSIASFHDFISILKALPKATRLCPRILLMQIGHNYIENETNKLVNELGLQSHIRFAGAVAHHEMPKYLALAHAYIASVRRDRFNDHRLPSKIPEYMAMGRPMLIMDHGFGNQLEDGSEVIKVQNDSEPELGRGLERLVRTQNFWPAMGKRLRRKAKELFDWKRNTDFLISYYEEILESSRELHPEGFGLRSDPPNREATGYLIREESSTVTGERGKPMDATGTKRKKIVIYTDGLIGEKMSGTGIRYLEIARKLSSTFDVALGHRFSLEIDDPGVKIFKWSPDKPELSMDFARDADFVLTHGFVLEKLPHLREKSKTLIVDLYCPFVFENVEIHRDRGVPLVERHQIHRNDLRVLLEQLRIGDFFLACTERQRDWILGMLTALGHLHPGNCSLGSSPEDFVALVPFGLPDDVPKISDRPVMKGVWQGVSENDFVLLWGGGLWSWLDPLTVVKAMKIVSERRSDIKLIFMSLKTAESVIEMPMMQEVLSLASQLGVEGRSVIFNKEFYIDYEERMKYFMEADLGVCAHLRTIETYFSFRTRILDCLNVGLPILISEGDYFSEYIDRVEVGRALPIGDADAWAETILELAEEPEKIAAYRQRVLRERGNFTWRRSVEPLAQYCLTANAVRKKDKWAVEVVRRSGQEEWDASELESTVIDQLAVDALARIGGMREAYFNLEEYASSLSTELEKAKRGYSELEAFAENLVGELGQVKLDSSREISTLKEDLQRTRERYEAAQARAAHLQAHSDRLDAKVDLIRRIPLMKRVWNLVHR